MVIGFEEGFLDAGEDMVPGERLFEVSGAVTVEIRVQANLFKGGLPVRHVELVGPGVKPGAILPGVQNDFCEPPIAAGQPGFQEGRLRVVPGHFDLCAVQTLMEDIEFLLDRFEVVKTDPLEGGMGFRDEGADPGMNTGAPADDPPAFRQDGFAEFCDGGDIFQCLLRVADHEVQFDRIPAVFENGADGFHEVFIADRFVDDGAQSFRAGFGR